MNPREEGIKAIIYLQSLAGIEEPRDKAERAWDGFSFIERTTTMTVYKTLAPKTEES